MALGDTANLMSSIEAAGNGVYSQLDFVAETSVGEAAIVRVIIEDVPDSEPIELLAVNRSIPGMEVSQISSLLDVLRMNALDDDGGVLNYHFTNITPQGLTLLYHQPVAEGTHNLNMYFAEEDPSYKLMLIETVLARLFQIYLSRRSEIQDLSVFLDPQNLDLKYCYFGAANDTANATEGVSIEVSHMFANRDEGVPLWTSLQQSLGTFMWENNLSWQLSQLAVNGQLNALDYLFNNLKCNNEQDFWNIVEKYLGKLEEKYAKIGQATEDTESSEP